MSVGATIICRKCRQKVSINSVRYDQNGRDLICMECYDKQSWAMKKAGFAERRDPAPTVKLATPKETKPIKPKKPSEKSRYICTSCNYKFSISKDSTQARRCPYCGKDTLEEDKFDINELISESDLPE
jgi:DNA-directed RNA polymerase subunit RPC12/RpoP